MPPDWRETSTAFVRQVLPRQQDLVPGIPPPERCVLDKVLECVRDSRAREKARRRRKAQQSKSVRRLRAIAEENPIHAFAPIDRHSPEQEKALQPVWGRTMAKRNGEAGSRKRAEIYILTLESKRRARIKRDFRQQSRCRLA